MYWFSYDFQKTFISLNSINQLIFVMKTRCVLLQYGLSCEYTLDELRLQRVNSANMKTVNKSQATVQLIYGARSLY
jgi:hypothetical protein